MNQASKHSDLSSSSRFPRTIVAVSRKEFFDPIELIVRDAQGNTAKLPDDLCGHYFLISPTGLPDSAEISEGNDVVWATKDGWTPIYNGDGMVYRLSFENYGCNLKTRLIKPPCYYADVAASDRSKKEYEDLAFQSLGISRISLGKLGIRNQLNTNFVPFKLADEASDRLLVTWDMGRPYEIDPETLETLHPIGSNTDWYDLSPSQQSQPFKQVMSTAHPVFDPATNWLFTVNVGKSIWTTLALPRSLQERLAENAVALKSTIDKSALSQNIQANLLRLYSFFLSIVGLLVNILSIAEKIFRFVGKGYDFVHLLAWDGKQTSISNKWNIVLPGNKPLKVDQTIHQMGVTKDYIVFAESSFKFSLDNILPYQKDYLATAFKVLLADFINYPQYSSTKLYIVKKSDLEQAKVKSNKFKAWLTRDRFKDIPKVVAKEVAIAPEFSHYLVDYDNPNNQIVVHVSHLAATDIAEYIRIFDRSVYDDRDRDDKYDDPELTYRLHQLAGNVVSPMDISRLGRIVIDAETGKIIEQKSTPNEDNRQEINQQIAAGNLAKKYQLTWSSAFYIYHDRRPSDRLTDLFWNSWGCWPDALTPRTVEAYRRYPHRFVEIDNVIDLTYKGVPSSLCHLKIDADSTGKTSVELDPNNYYQFPNRFLGTSAQFIPRPNATDQTDGYIVCVVLTSDEFLSQNDRDDNDPEWSQNSEIWVFDAQKLNQGPLYKMSHPQLNIGFSFHTTWMPEAKSPSRRLEYNVREDYEYLVQDVIANQPELGDKIRELFDEEIYPNFE